MDNNYPSCPFLSIFGQLFFLLKILLKKNYGNNVENNYNKNRALASKTKKWVIFSVRKKKFVEKNSKWTKKSCPF